MCPYHSLFPREIPPAHICSSTQVSKSQKWGQNEGQDEGLEDGFNSGVDLRGDILRVATSKGKAATKHAVSMRRGNKERSSVEDRVGKKEDLEGQVKCELLHLFFFVFIFGRPTAYGVPGEGSDLSHSQDPKLQLRQGRILNHCARPGINPGLALPKCHRSHCTTVGTPEIF